MNLYEILEVSKDADKAEIKKAYRRLSKVHHPDVGGDKEKFGEISKAYQILMDEKNREKYDNGEDVDNILKSQDDRHLSIIASVFCQVLYSADPETQDIIEVVKKTISMTSLEIAKDIINKEGLKKRFNVCLKKIKHKESENILSQITNNNIRSLQKQIDEAKAEQESLKKALEMMEDFGYDLGEQQFLLDAMSVFGGATTTSI